MFDILYLIYLTLLLTNVISEGWCDCLTNVLATIIINHTCFIKSRLCREKNLSEACVKLSALLGLWQGAVELALQVDLNLAKSVANMPDEPEMQRQMWLNIGKLWTLVHSSRRERGVIWSDVNIRPNRKHTFWLLRVDLLSHFDAVRVHSEASSSGRPMRRKHAGRSEDAAADVAQHRYVTYADTKPILP